MVKIQENLRGDLWEVLNFGRFIWNDPIALCSARYFYHNIFSTFI